MSKVIISGKLSKNQYRKIYKQKYLLFAVDPLGVAMTDSYFPFCSTSRSHPYKALRE